MIGDFFLDGVKLQARMESLCSHSEAENLTQWSGHLKGRKTGFQALASLQKIGVVIGGVAGIVQKIFGQVSCLFFFQDTQVLPCECPLKVQSFP